MSTGIAALVMASGCSAVTDFDFDFADGATPMDAGPDADAGMDGGDTDGGPRDGGPFDGGPGDGGGPDGGDPDDGGPDDGGPEDGGSPSCDTGCVDAVRDFRMTQDGPWRYLADTRDAVGVEYTFLEPGLWGGGRAAWVLDDESPPAIQNCSDSPLAPQCTGVEDSLLFVADTPGAGDDPAIEHQVDSGGVYDIEVRADFADTVSSTPQAQILVSRNVRHALLAETTFDPSSAPVTLSVDASLLAGERIVVTVRPPPDAGESPEPVALNVVIRETGEGLPGDCIFAAPFDGSPALRDACGGRSASDDGTASVNSVSLDRLGMARALESGDSIEWDGPSFLFAGDFTIDLWLSVSSMSGGQPTVLSIPGALDSPLFELYDGTVEALVHHAPENTPKVVEGAAPRDGSWHLYRLVRSTDDGAVRLCIDGEFVDAVSVPSGASVAGGESLWVGKQQSDAVELAGAIDDVRITQAALPCR